MLEVFANNGEASVTTTHGKATLVNASIEVTSPSLRDWSGSVGNAPLVGVAVTVWAMQPSIE